MFEISRDEMQRNIKNVSNLPSLILEGTLTYQCLRYQELTVCYKGSLKNVCC